MATVKELEKRIKHLEQRVSVLEGTTAEDSWEEHEEIREEATKPVAAKQVRKEPKTPSMSGGAVLGWLGGIIFALGLLFLVSYAFQQGWVSRGMQVVLGVIAGGAIAGLGAWLHKKRPLQGSLVSGAGVAVAYFSIFAGYAVDSYRAATGLSVVATSILLAVIIIIAGWLSVKQQSETLLIESYLLAQLSVFLASFTGLTVAYLAVFTAALCWLILTQKWTRAGWISGGIAFGFLFIAVYRSSFWEATILTGLYFLAFVTLALKRNNSFAQVMTLIGAWFMGLLISIRHDIEPAWTTLVAAALSLGLAVLAGSRKQQQWPQLLAGIGLLILWVPMQLSGAWIEISWILLAVALIAFANNERELLRIPAGAAFALAFMKVAVLGGFTDAHWWVVAVAVLAFTAGSEIAFRRSYFEHHLLCAAAFVLALIGIYMHLPNEAFTLSIVALSVVGLVVGIDRRRLAARYAGMALAPIAYITSLMAGMEPWLQITSQLAIAAVLLGMSYQYAIKDEWDMHLLYVAGIVALVVIIGEHTSSVWVTVLWGVLGGLSLLLGLNTDRPVPKNTGLVILAIAILKLFLVDTLALSAAMRIVAYVVLGALLLAGSLGYAHYSKKE